MEIKIFVLLTVLSHIQSTLAYVLNVDETKFHLVKSYLCRYGYMNENVCKQHADDSLKFMQNNARDMYRGLVIFQTMFNITKTGRIDEETIMKMAKPRCGNKDFDLHFSSSRFLNLKKNDYSLLRKGLTKLSYSIKKYNPYLNRYSKSMSNEMVDEAVEKAFQIWLQHLNGQVKVNRLSEKDELFDNSNITLYFAEGNHGDSLLFDGIDGELAHSCSLSNTNSPYRGHIHLDDSENWSKGNRLMAVILHEIGHLFGLDHSSNVKSVMSPLFNFGSDAILAEDVKNLKMILGIETETARSGLVNITAEAIIAPTTTKKSTTRPTTTTTKTTRATTKPTTKTTTTRKTTTTTITTRTTTTTTKTTTKTTTTRSQAQRLQAQSKGKAPDTMKSSTKSIKSTTAASSSTSTEVYASDEMRNFDLGNLTSSEIDAVLNATSEQLADLDYSGEYVDEDDDYEELMHLIEQATNKTMSEREDAPDASDSSFTAVASKSKASYVVDRTEMERELTTKLGNVEYVDLAAVTPRPVFTKHPVIAAENAHLIQRPNKFEYLQQAYNHVEPVQQQQQKVEMAELPAFSSVLPVSATSSTARTFFLITKTQPNVVYESRPKAAAYNETEFANEYEKPADLCRDPHIDAITRTEWGNAFIFKGSYIWHVRGLTKWRLFDYEGWPKKIVTLFSRLPSNIDSAYHFGEHYFFTKNDLIWKYKPTTSYPPKYDIVDGYPRLLKDEYPYIPFNSVDSAFSVSASIFFFKDYDFWQSDWNSNITGKMPIKTNAAVGWRNPRVDSSLSEPLAYLIANSSMYRFNYWSMPISQDSMDIRYFLFDCVQTNAKPDSQVFLGPSYKQAFLSNDLYNGKPNVQRLMARSPRLIRHARNHHHQHHHQNQSHVAAAAVTTNNSTL